MSKEYEYSFKVKDVNIFVDYCIDHCYERVEDYKQVRTLYKNGGKIMARITKNIYDEKVVEILDFKDDNLANNTLSVSRETEELIITDENRKFVESLIELLNLNDKTVLERYRVIYQQKGVKFEIDEYTFPKMKVVAIEGLEKEVDRVYKELENVIAENKID